MWELPGLEKVLMLEIVDQSVGVGDWGWGSGNCPKTEGKFCVFTHLGPCPYSVLIRFSLEWDPKQRTLSRSVPD